MLFALRVIATVTGVGILIAATLATIEAGGLHGSHALLIIALAAGVAAGAVVIGRARWPFAIVVGAAMLAGEGYGLLTTAERVIQQREASAAAVHATNDARGDARARLLRAEQAAAAFEVKAAETVATRGCAQNCRQLLEQQRADLLAEVKEARSALGGAPAAKSATPLADRLGLAPWLLDIIAASLLSIGANGLAAALIAWGCHASRQPDVVEVEAHPQELAAVPLSIEERPLALPAPDDGEVAQFLDQATRAAAGVATPVGQLYSAYEAWCRRNGLQPATLTRFGYRLSECGARKVKINGRVVVQGRVAA